MKLDKESARLFWYVKGHLNSSIQTINESHDGYFKRLWCLYQGGDELIRADEGFEEAYNERIKSTEYN